MKGKLVFTIIICVFASIFMQGASVFDAFNPNIDGTVMTTAIMPDGKIAVGGSFDQINGASWSNLAILNTDGNRDAFFTHTANAMVRGSVIQPDGKLIIVGNFTNIGGVAKSFIARFGTDYSLDASFSSSVNNNIYCATIQSDGKILIGGEFSQVGGVSRSYLARLNSDGSYDSSFTPTLNEKVRTISVDHNGRILIGGDFTQVNDSTRNFIARLHPNGTLDTSFNPGANAQVFDTKILLDGRILVGGMFTNIAGTDKYYIARLKYDGTIDPGLNITPNNYVRTIALVDDGRILIGGNFLEVNAIWSERMALVDLNGNLDSTFSPAINNNVHTISVQHDGKIVFGGEFTTVKGVARNRIARLYINGFLDTMLDLNFDDAVLNIAYAKNDEILVGGGFENVSAVSRKYLASLNVEGSLSAKDANLSGYVYNVSTLAEGGMHVSGVFTSVNGVTQRHIAKLHDNFTLDTNFSDPDTNQYLYAHAVDKNGDVYIGGRFTTLKGGISRGRFAKLKSNGDLDNDFISVNFDNYVYSIYPLDNGKVLVGGAFWMVNGETLPGLIRLNSDGSIDYTFQCNYISSAVNSIVVDQFDRILIGGTFQNVMGYTRNRMARLFSDGSVDESFDPNFNGIVYGITLQTDGKIMVGGSFTQVGGVATQRLVRLNSDGSKDTDFTVSADSTVNAVTIQPDGKILVGGMFSTLGGASRVRLGRISADEAVIQTLKIEGEPQKIIWQRGQSAPLVKNCEFFYSINDGLTWIPIGSGISPTGSHWEINWTENLMDQNFLIKARGKVLGGGIYSNSEYYIEMVKQFYIRTPVVDIYGCVSFTNTDTRAIRINLHKNGAFLDHAYTNASGNFEFTGLQTGATYTLNPNEAHFSFDPVSRNYPNLMANIYDANFLATIDKWSIGGYVGTGAGPLVDVTIEIPGLKSQNTSGAGTYTLTELDAGATYTLVPSKTHYTFIPVDRTYTDLSGNIFDADFEAVLNKWTISGIITDGTDPISNITVNIGGGIVSSTSTSDTGYYAFTGLAAGLNYTVTPSADHYDFDPIDRTYTDLSQDQLSADFTAIIDTWNMSGIVTDENTDVMSGVSVQLTGGVIINTTTSDTGYYVFKNIPAGQDYTITPSKDHYTFNPASATIENLESDHFSVNFTGTLNRHTVWGNILDEKNNPLANVEIHLTGGSDTLTYTNELGNYYFNNIPAGINYTITPSLKNYDFDPQNHSFLLSNEDVEFAFTATRTYLADADKVFIYPNPVKTEFKIDALPENTVVKLFTSDGHLIKEWTEDVIFDIVFHFSDVTNFTFYNGRYMIFIKFPDGSQAVKPLYYYGGTK